MIRKIVIELSHDVQYSVGSDGGEPVIIPASSRPREHAVERVRSIKDAATLDQVRRSIGTIEHQGAPAQNGRAASGEDRSRVYGVVRIKINRRPGRGVECPA